MSDPYKLVLVNLILAVSLGIICLVYLFIFPKKKINLLFLLILISILPIISIFRPGTYESGDLTLHSVYLQSFYENIIAGNILPQWAAGLCAGYGCPVFLFLYSVPYYIGSFFHALGFSYLDSTKLFLASAYILSGITMYVFIKDSFNEKQAFFASLLYLFAPMHFIELHFRVSVGAVAAFIFMPLVFLFAQRSLSGKPIFIVLGALNILLLLASHSSAALIIVLTSLIYVFIKKKKLSHMIFPILSIILGLGLAAFYILPAVFEVKYTWYGLTMRYIQDFKPIFEYIFSPARFGLLFQGNFGELRLIVGYAQLSIVVLAIYMLQKNKFQKNEKPLGVFLVLFFIICFILMQSFTEPIWNQVFFLRSFQFPWRLLDVIAFITAFLGAIVSKNWKKTTLILMCIFTIGVTILNWGNRKMVPLDKNAPSYQYTLYTEYVNPQDPSSSARYTNSADELALLTQNRHRSNLDIISGKGSYKEIFRLGTKHEYILNAKTFVTISENTYYFPGWTILINGKVMQPIITDKRRYGVMVLSLPKGLYDIKATFLDTPIRKIGKSISVSTILICIALLIFPIIRRIVDRNQDLL